MKQAPLAKIYGCKVIGIAGTLAEGAKGRGNIKREC